MRWGPRNESTGKQSATIQGASARQFLPPVLFWPVVFLIAGTVAAVTLILWPGFRTQSSNPFPVDWGRDVGLVLDTGVDWVTVNLSGFFRAIRDGVLIFLTAIKNGLLQVPWPATIIFLALISLRLVGWKMALFSLVALLFLGFMGLWESTVETISLVIVTVSLSMLLGIPIGLAAGRSERVNAILRPILDGMQTMPSYVYLVPAIAFFSIGDVPAVMATIIYAVPPVIRLTNLGIRQVSQDTMEAGRSMGATTMQILFKVQVPLALPTIMAGVNQTTLLALSMVVIAALVGAGGLGEDVFRALGRIETGNAFIAGLGIVFLAVMVDRLTQSYTKQKQQALGITA